LNEAREVMNLRQASVYLGVSPDTLYRYVSEGVVPAFKLGNRWKLRKSVLDRWMETKMNAPRPAVVPKPASQTRPKNPPRRASLQTQASHD
jgi:excisionase family DNA binding protein